jgi:hypothetical protein
VSGVAYFGLGALWYGVFAEPWMRGIGKTRNQLESRASDYIVSFVSEVVIMYFLAVALNAFGIANVWDAVFVGAVVWFGFSLLPAVVHYAYEDRSFGLLAVNKGYDLLGILVGAIIIGVWQ